MKDQLEELERWGADVIFGRTKGIRATLMRLVLQVLSWVFKVVVKIRVWRYQSGRKEQCYLGTQTISIGNLTMGGTGKTPVVELLAKSLSERGRKVAILSRGYKSEKLKRPQRWLRADGKVYPRDEMPCVVSAGEELLVKSRFAGDEPYMLAKNLPGVAVLVGKYRVKSARFAVTELACDTLLLDDGMQYLDLAHGFDIVLIDSKMPFGTESMIPRGTLREPPSHLKRASYIMITKCDGFSNEALIDRIRRYNSTAEIIECAHGPIHLENVFTGEIQPLEALKGKWVGAISAIAVPEAFENLLESLGAKVEIRRRFADHHSFHEKDVNRFMQRCLDRDMDWIVTTEKDAVRFPTLDSIDVPIYFLRIEVKILRGQEYWDEMLDRFSKVRPVFESVLRNVEHYEF